MKLAVTHALVKSQQLNGCEKHARNKIIILTESQIRKKETELPNKTCKFPGGDKNRAKRVYSKSTCWERSCRQCLYGLEIKHSYLTPMAGSWEPQGEVFNENVIALTKMVHQTRRVITSKTRLQIMRNLYSSKCKISDVNSIYMHWSIQKRMKLKLSPSLSLFLSLSLSTHTHTHNHIYIYIYSKDRNYSYTHKFWIFFSIS